jgi:nucleotide-binding universal stress UspA family protein
MQTIVVAYDETPPAKRALTRVAQLAKAFDAKVVVTSVAPLLHSSPRAIAQVDPTDSLADHDEELAGARAYFEEQGITPDLVHATGDPATSIVRLAEERNADLVVVGTREPGVVDRVLRQSVSQNVARHSRRDVLIVHPEH